MKKSSSHSTLDSSWMWPALLRLCTLLPVDVSAFYMPNYFIFKVLSTISMKSYKLNTFLKDGVSRDVLYFSHLASKNLSLREQVPNLQDFTRFLFCFLIFVLYYIFKYYDLHTELCFINLSLTFQQLSFTPLSFHILYHLYFACVTT